MKITEQLFLSAFGDGVKEYERIISEFKVLKADFDKFRGIQSKSVNKEKITELNGMVAEHKQLRSYLSKLKGMGGEFLEETDMEYLEVV